jgi:hypothetical protein
MGITRTGQSSCFEGVHLPRPKGLHLNHCEDHNRDAILQTTIQALDSRTSRIRMDDGAARLSCGQRICEAVAFPCSMCGEALHGRRVSQFLLPRFQAMNHRSELSRFIEISTGISPQMDLRGDFRPAVNAVGKMLVLPHLKRMTFRGHLDPFIEQLIKDNEGKKDIIEIVPHPQ